MPIDLDLEFDEESLVPDIVLDTKPLSPKADAAVRLKSIEESIYVDALDIVDCAGKAAEIDPAQDNPPDEWVERYGFDVAKQRYRVARAAWLSAKEAPVFLQMAQKTIAGVQKARASENVVRALGMVVEFHVDAMPAYPVKKLDK